MWLKSIDIVLAFRAESTFLSLTLDEMPGVDSRRTSSSAMKATPLSSDGQTSSPAGPSEKKMKESKDAGSEEKSRGLEAEETEEEEKATEEGAEVSVRL